MHELIKKELDEANNHMERAIKVTRKELAKVRVGKATPSMLDDILITCYDKETSIPLNQLSNVQASDPRTLVIEPWDKSLLPSIEKSLQAPDLNLNPQNDGTRIRIIIPQPTEERRKDLVKKVKSEAEKHKVIIRNIRKQANEKIKHLKGKGVSEDELKKADADIQNLTNSFTVKIDQLVAAKEKDIMTI